MKDERTISVENASYRLAYTIASFGLLGLAVFRSFIYKQETWDLLGLAIVSSLAATLYQAAHKTITWRWIYLFMAAAVVGAVVAVLLAYFRFGR
jgi:1,4-dihydroxy-2-naphthoate octaprenyltransferase